MGLCVKVEPAAFATEQINLKRNPERLLPTSMAMEITENYFKMRTRLSGRSDVILPPVPQFPRHVSSENMSVCVCVQTDKAQRRILGSISTRCKSDVLSWCSQKNLISPSLM